MKFTAWIPIDEGESVEGNFYAGESPDGYSTKRTDEVCPFCSAPLELVKASVFGRIVQDTGKRNPAGDQALGLVELMPPTHEALSCSGCDTVFTRLKGAEAYGPREAAI
jgi:hypothetical protein